MRVVLILAVGLLFENFVLAQTEENTSRIKDLNVEKGAIVEELATPSSLLVNRPPLFAEFSSILLAPQYGTDVSIAINQSQVKFGRTNSDRKSSGVINYSLGVLAVAHAITPQFFIGANVSYGQNTSDDEYVDVKMGTTDVWEKNAHGVADPIFNIGGRVNMGNVSTILVLGVSPRTEDNETEYTKSSDSKRVSEANLKKGGNAFIPSVTIFSNSKASPLLGVSLSYALMQERLISSKNSSGQTTEWKTTHGNVQNISAFVESPNNQISFGGSLNYVKFEPVSNESKFDSYSYESDSLAYTTLTGFVKINTNKKFVLIPSATVGRLGEGASALDAKDIYSLGLTAKSVF